MNENKTRNLWIATVILALAALASIIIFPENKWAVYGTSILFIASFGFVAMQARSHVSKRTAAFGLNSGITVLLVIALVGVVNFLAEKHVKKFDLTRGKSNTLSDQTEKTVKNLSTPVKAILFSKSDPNEREKYRPLLENYKALNSKFEIEYVDTDREIQRVKQAGIKVNGTTLQLLVGSREAKIDSPDEEKLTNAIIKLSRDKSPVVCALTQHGEKSFSSNSPDGFDAVKKLLTNQSYEVQDLNLIQEGKIPERCSLLVVIGPNKGLFEQETKLIREYLLQGGRALVTFDLAFKGNPEASPEFSSLIKDYGVKADLALIIDPVSKMLQLEPTIPVIPTYNKDISITKDFQGNCAFPITRPLEILKDAPKELKIQWLIQTTPNSWGVTDLGTLSKGAVSFNASRDLRGPLYAGIAVDGKLPGSKATRNTRLVVFGSTLFATNQFGRLGNNFDLFVNSISWLIDDESMISIRKKEEEGSIIQLTQVQGSLILFITVILMPILIAVVGIVVWVRRKKL